MEILEIAREMGELLVMKPIGHLLDSLPFGQSGISLLQANPAQPLAHRQLIPLGKMPLEGPQRDSAEPGQRGGTIPGLIRENFPTLGRFVSGGRRQ